MSRPLHLSSTSVSFFFFFRFLGPLSSVLVGSSIESVGFGISPDIFSLSPYRSELVRRIGRLAEEGSRKRTSGIDVQKEAERRGGQQQWRASGA
uniref:Putative secreted protein n=1 Tax=Ixodes ricinus TaxID=34613 RepID=A0A6B0U8S9_IXORI